MADTENQPEVDEAAIKAQQEREKCLKIDEDKIMNVRPAED